MFWHMHAAAAILILVLQALAFGKTLPWSMLPFGVGRCVWLALSVGFLVWFARPRFLEPKRILEWAGHRAALMSFALLTVAYLVFDLMRFREMGYGVPLAHFVILACTVPFLRRDRLWLSFGVSVLLL